jgi:hypothetical protein
MAGGSNSSKRTPPQQQLPLIVNTHLLEPSRKLRPPCRQLGVSRVWTRLRRVVADWPAYWGGLAVTPCWSALDRLVALWVVFPACSTPVADGGAPP